MRKSGPTVAVKTARALALSASLIPTAFAIRLGLVTGIATTLGTVLNPYIEYYADNLPEKRLGVFGIWLVLCGFALQSFQYWIAILDIPVN